MTLTKRHADPIMRALALLLVLASFLSGCRHSHSGLKERLESYVAEKADSRIGVAVIIDGRDTVQVNGYRQFPMMSVYKFPIALAVADRCRAAGDAFSDTLLASPGLVVADTYSPMLSRYPAMTSEATAVTIDELLVYALQLSDNNASDLLLDYVGSAAAAQEYIDGLGCGDIGIVWSEAAMYQDNARSYDNSATPVAIAGLFDRFDRECNDTLSLRIKGILETCATGRDRLAAPLEGSGALLGHKTGTGFTLPDGRLMALNDAGYVHLPDGRRYTIAVFVADSGYGPEDTAAIIADISALVYESVGEEF